MEKLKLRRFLTLAAMISLTFGLLVQGANGQEDRDGQPYQFFRAEIDRIESARYRLGPFRIFPSIEFNMGYDNNVFRSGKPEFMIADYTARISIPINIYLHYKNWIIFTLTELPEYAYYFETKGLRGLNNSFSSQIKVLLLNRFVVSGRFLNSRIRRRVTVEFDSPIYENQRVFSGSIFYEPGGRISLGFSSSIGEMRYEEFNASRQLNRSIQSNVLSLNYRFSGESQFFLSGGYSQFSFKEFVFQSRDTDSYWINSGITFPLFGKVRGILSFGYSKVMPKDELWPDFSGMVANTSLEWSINRFRFRIRYFRNTSFSLASNLYFVNEGFGSGVSFFLTQSIRLGYDFNYNKTRYPLPALDNLADGMNAENFRLDNYRLHSVRIIFRLIGDTGIGIDVNYWERNSNLIGLGRNNTSVLIYLTTSFAL